MRKQILILALGVAAAGCGKYADFFDPGVDFSLQPASITVNVTGAPSPLPISLLGPGGATISAQVAQSQTFSNLASGTWSFSTTAPAGYTCSPLSQSVTLGRGGSATIDVVCTPIPQSTIIVNVTGSPSALPITLTGPGGATISAQVAQSQTFSNLTPGTWNFSTTAPPGYTCTPLTQSATLGANGTFTIDVICTPIPQATIIVNVTGSSSPLPVTLTGPGGATRSAQVGQSQTFSNLTPGTWNFSTTAPPGYTCMPLTQSVTLGPGGTFTIDVTCTPIPPATIVVNVTGAPSPLPVTLTGPGGATISAQVGQSQTFSNLAPGTWMFSTTAPQGYSCTPLTQTATIGAGGTFTIDVVCTPLPGTINVTVTGVSSASVSISGPTPTSGTVTGSRSFAGLAPGNYTVTITPPAGFTCTPTSVQVTLPAGGSQSVSFSCSQPPPIDFLVNLTLVSWIHIAFGGGPSNTCVQGGAQPSGGGVANLVTAFALAGSPYTITWSGPGVVGTATRNGTLDANGQFFDRQGISAFGTYTVTVSVTSGGLTRTATGTTSVNSGAGSCPAP